MKSKTKAKSAARARIKARVRKIVKGTPERPRLSVFRSGRHIYAQIIDDVTGKTLVACSSLAPDLADEVKKAKNRLEVSRAVGKAIARSAAEKKISDVVFDRGGYLYHGRVKALAEGSREGGLKF